MDLNCCSLRRRNSNSSQPRGKQRNNLILRKVINNIKCLLYLTIEANCGTRQAVAIVGDHSSRDEDTTEAYYGAKAFHMHKDYDSTSLINDIALIEV